ncbi:ComEC/Rec2 family competence protein [Algoriphagus terrigena]|uniref:ComEC/Rec2 family competence protein n=1 Tax=Algoriphagus terrigena TaxID=344884 RepID=UPI00041D870D|nr:ComEC/Rec2 family competence protein [Algoriphagus terrigena]
MRFADFPFLRYLPFLIAGVFLSQQGFPVSILISAVLIGLCWVIYAVFLSRKKNFNKLVPATLGYGMLFLLGLLLSEIQKIHAADSFDPSLESCDSYLARVGKFDVPKPNSQENILEVVQFKDSLGWHDSKGKVLIYHKGKSQLLPGQVILVDGAPETIPPPIFPDEFDYRGFLARKDIHFRQFIGEKHLLVDSSDTDSPKFWLERLRKSLAEIIAEKVPNPESRQIAAALLLGQKESLDREIRNAYAETGTMHILAVSGLHVGIIYAILLFPLKGIRLTSRQRKSYLVLVVVLIWIYAVLTGFSPSVIRAATMFSLLTAGQMRDRKPSPWNILAFSALIMIVMDPAVIFEVGFQLSYLAVGGILLLQPLILRWWLPRNRALEYIWQMTAVSLAAQLATFPLSVLYFHIFPSYFLIANLVIIPLSFVVMNTGILLLALHWIPWIGAGLGWAVNGLIWFQNWITRTIQQFPGGNMERLTITFSGMLLIWVLLIVWANWEWGDRKKLIYLSALLFFIWSTDQVIREVRRPATEILIFSGEKGILMDFKVGESIYSWNEDFPPEQISFSIEPNRIAEHRPQIPESAFAVEEGEVLWFPLGDFRFDKDSRKFRWGKDKPIRIEQFSFPNSWESLASDSLIANNGAFRIVF